MDKNNFDQLGFPVNGDEPDEFGATREMDSIQAPDAEEDYSAGIAPRDKFTELNSADDPGSTRMMDSLSVPEEQDNAPLPPNPVRKRRKRRKAVSEMGNDHIAETQEIYKKMKLNFYK